MIYGNHSQLIACHLVTPNFFFLIVGSPGITPTLTPPHTSLNYSFLGWWFHIWAFSQVQYQIFQSVLGINPSFAVFNQPF